MALGDIQLRFAWQAWHLVTAGVALGDIYLRFAWQSWHSWHCGTRLDLVARLGALGSFRWQAWHLVTSTVISRGRWHWAGSGSALGGSWVHLVAGAAAVLCVAGVALGDIHLRFAWQAWHLVTSNFVSRGRPGTW